MLSAVRNSVSTWVFAGCSSELLRMWGGYCHVAQSKDPGSNIYHVQKVYSTPLNFFNPPATRFSKAVNSADRMMWRGCDVRHTRAGCGVDSSLRRCKPISENHQEVDWKRSVLFNCIIKTYCYVWVTMSQSQMISFTQYVHIKQVPSFTIWHFYCVQL